MHAARPFLEDLALVLGVAALTTVVFRRFRQPVVLGYLLAGLIVGPHTPVPLFADPERLHSLSELGVILVMFSIGLEFRVSRLARSLPTAGLVGLVQVSLMFWLGTTVGQAFGWTARECLFTGAIVAISSTMIVAKVFAEQGIRGRLADLVYGVLVVEDLAAVLLLAILATLSPGASTVGQSLGGVAAGLAAFLVGFVALGFLIIPRAVRAIARLDSPETLLVASIGLCFALALLAQSVGYSLALGAFLAGSLIAESGEGGQVERLVASVRDVFAAVFFVSVGTVVDPLAIVPHWPAILTLTAVVLVGTVVSVSLPSFLVGYDVRTSLRAGMCLAQIGEFSFIIAGLGAESGAVREFFYPTTVAVSMLTTFATPWLVRASEPVALALDRRLPHPLQTFVALYGSWLERVRAGAQTGTLGARGRRLAGWLIVDAASIFAIVAGTSVAREQLVELALRYVALPEPAARGVIVVLALALGAPFAIGVIRTAHALGALLAAAALPAAPDGALDLAAAPRRALVVTLQLALVLLVGVPLLALTQPFLPIGRGAALLALALGLLGIGFWRSAANLEGHVRAGAQMIIEGLVRQAGPEPRRRTLERVSSLVPGLGELRLLELEADDPAVGRTLAQLNLRGLTGASVIALTRGSEGVVVPSGHEVLRAGDVLALAGSHDAIESARELLLSLRESASPGGR